ncbi:MAG: DUF3822 family protein [Bacteroidetes bacterium]|nr:DUF3822 family protein [Bacteroidota bacterium]
METGNNKIKLNHQLVDEAFDPKSASSQHLSIQLGLDGLSFCIRANNKFQLLKSYSFSRIFNWQQLSDEAESLLKIEEIAEKKYQAVHISIVHQIFSLIPAPLFDPLNQKDYLKLNAEFDQKSQIINELIRAIDARNIFALPGALEKMLNRNFGACKISHHTSILLESVFSLYKNSNEPQLIVNVNQGSFDILLIAENKLHFCNSFKYHADEDIAYYLLFTCEQLKLNPENINITLAGQIEKTSTLFELLSKYLRNLKFIKRPANYDYSYKFNEAQGHLFYGLLNL